MKSCSIGENMMAPKTRCTSELGVNALEPGVSPFLAQVDRLFQPFFGWKTSKKLGGRTRLLVLNPAVKITADFGGAYFAGGGPPKAFCFQGKAHPGRNGLAVSC